MHHLIGCIALPTAPPGANCTGRRERPAAAQTAYPGPAAAKAPGVPGRRCAGGHHARAPRVLGIRSRMGRGPSPRAAEVRPSMRVSRPATGGVKGRGQCDGSVFGVRRWPGKLLRLRPACLEQGARCGVVPDGWLFDPRRVLFHSGRTALCAHTTRVRLGMAWFSAACSGHAATC